jgi:hypothetical protein
MFKLAFIERFHDLNKQFRPVTAISLLYAESKRISLYKIAMMLDVFFTIKTCFHSNVWPSGGFYLKGTEPPQTNSPDLYAS